MSRGSRPQQPRDTGTRVGGAPTPGSPWFQTDPPTADVHSSALTAPALLPQQVGQPESHTFPGPRGESRRAGPGKISTGPSLPGPQGQTPRPRTHAPRQAAWIWAHTHFSHAACERPQTPELSAEPDRGGEGHAT